MLEVRCEEHFDKVCEFARSAGLMEQLQKQLDYLSTYGYHPDDLEGRPENKCVLWKDFAPHSFDFTVFRRDPEKPDVWRTWLSGGLIFQSSAIPANGGAPSFTVSLAKGTGWFIHT